MRSDLQKAAHASAADSGSEQQSRWHGIQQRFLAQNRHHTEARPSGRIHEPPVLLISSRKSRTIALHIPPGDKVLLIIEDDPNFIPMLIDLAHEHGFKCVAAPRGDKGLRWRGSCGRRRLRSTSDCPIMAGWLVLSRLKYDAATRHIPVHVISVDEDYRRGLALGAESYMEKMADLEELAAGIRQDRTVCSSHRAHIARRCEEGRRKETGQLIGEGGGLTTVVGTERKQSIS